MTTSTAFAITKKPARLAFARAKRAKWRIFLFTQIFYTLGANFHFFAINGFGLQIDEYPAFALNAGVAAGRAGG